MSSEKLAISFPGSDETTAASYALELSDVIRDEVRCGVTLESPPVEHEARDSGVRVMAVLETTASTAVAQSIYKWLVRRTGVSLQIVTNRGQMLLESAQSKNFADMVSAFATLLGTHGPGGGRPK